MRIDVKREVERITKEGLKINKSRVARQIQCDPRTVNNYLENINKPKKKRKTRVKKTDGFEEIIKDKFLIGATAKSIYEFIKKNGYEGSYSTIKNFIKKFKDTSQKKATIRFETDPGIQGQVDWKENKKLRNKRGEVIEFNLFLFVLGYSRTKYIELTFDRKQDTLFKCLNNAFEYIGGVPREILFDNMKTVVDRQDTYFGKVSFNKKFKQFANDYGFTPVACKPYRPQTKGKVEALAKLTNRLDVYNGEFETIEELESIVNSICNELNNEISQANNAVPFFKLKKEQKHLLLLPSIPIRKSHCAPSKMYSVSKESMVTYKGNKYSVPIHLINKKVGINVVEDKLLIYYNTDLVTTHNLSESYLNYQKHHMVNILKSDAFKYKSEEDIDYYIENNLKMMDMIISED